MSDAPERIAIKDCPFGWRGWGIVDLGRKGAYNRGPRLERSRRVRAAREAASGEGQDTMKGLSMKRYIGITALVLTLFLTLPALALEQVETVTWEGDVFGERVVTIPAAEVPNGYTLAGVVIDFTETSCSWTAFWDGVPMPIDLTWTLAWYYEWFGGAGVGGTHEETALIDDAGTEFFMTTPAVYLDTNPIARRYLVDWDITARVASSYSLGGSGTLSARDHLWRGEITVTYTFSESKGIN